MHANSSTLSRRVKRLFFNMYRDGIIIEVKIEGFLENGDYLQIIWYYVVNLQKICTRR